MKKLTIIIPVAVVLLIACLGFLTMREYQKKAGIPNVPDSSASEIQSSAPAVEESSIFVPEEESSKETAESSHEEISSEPEESSEEIHESSSESSAESSDPADHEHEFEESVIEPTCETPGYKVYTCKICGFKHKDETEIPALGHDYVEYRTEVTCTEDGYSLYVCSRCQDQYTEGYEAALGHNYVLAERVNPSCENDGYILYRCSRCGSTYTETLPATGHNWTTETVTASHSSAGYVLHTCLNCGSQYKTDEVPQIEHSYQLTASAEPTCDTDGYKTYTCSCGDSYTETIPATGHDWIEVSYVKNPDGTTTHYYSCSKCGADDKKQTPN